MFLARPFDVLLFKDFDTVGSSMYWKIVVVTVHILQGVIHQSARKYNIV
jgi:hypothetical protein